MSCGPYYIEQEKYDLFKFVIREKVKNYGWVYNSYDFKNHIELSIVKVGPVPNGQYINDQFKYYEIFDEVLNDLDVYFGNFVENSSSSSILNR